MSDKSISIVPKQSNYANKDDKSGEILNWLVSRDIVKPILSNCILISSKTGYVISLGAQHVTNPLYKLPFDLIPNGLEIITERNVFHTGGNGIDKCICPNCKKDIASEDWNFLNDWIEQKSNNIICPLCKVASDIHEYKFSPEWGFSDLGFTFWNWPDFTSEFIEEFKQKLGYDISIVFQKV